MKFAGSTKPHRKSGSRIPPFAKNAKDGAPGASSWPGKIPNPTHTTYTIVLVTQYTSGGVKIAHGSGLIQDIY